MDLLHTSVSNLLLSAFFFLPQDLHPNRLVSSQEGKYPLSSKLVVAEVEERVDGVSGGFRRRP